MATIELERVKKVYPNGTEAVHDLDLKIDEGELLVLVGPSGCGKTTVLRMIAGLEEITSGTLKFGERIVNDMGPKERDIAMVFQNYALYPHMTVAANIGFALRLRQLSKAEIHAKVQDAARILGLTPLLDRKPAQLSGGQRQRVAMGRAIVRNPAVFLMDEPLSNLDAKLRVQMRAEITQIQRTVGVATVYVTHDQVEAMTMGHRVCVMRDGFLQQCDTPQVLYDRPVNLFVAAFIGSPAMNLYEATMTAGCRSVRLGTQEIELSDEARSRRPALAAYAERPVILGIRPENLPGADDASGPGLRVEVQLVEALGSELQVHFSIDAKRVVAESGEAEELMTSGAGVARVAPHTSAQAGDSMRLAVDVDALHFFDPETGRAIRD
ncbi:MAG TPA: sn-glycerol-3-phosphate ABC transporter ATP-binding protein UgpC [Solirubrobacteraceae bacterium]|nr:sn-glycerol-3-phosphate ABC transporter ATP-binding protein UgpC [Solirubrobacteraceae bacterium]